MSQCAGAGAAFGLLLSDFPEVSELLAELRAYIQQCKDDGSYYDANDPEDLPRISEFRDRFVKVLSDTTVMNLPEGLELIWTGSEDTRPGECDTPSDDWVLGYGLLSDPTKYPHMYQTFLNRAEWHTWAWSE